MIATMTVDGGRGASHRGMIATTMTADDEASHRSIVATTIVDGERRASHRSIVAMIAAKDAAPRHLSTTGNVNNVKRHSTNKYSGASR